ncbi:MAG TPA: glycosyltransferase [Patescibacteria group bacterium]|nr:glycosyltransferase [Patescibacteria group bacterium]
MRVALVHDHLNQFGGAERVLFACTQLFPKAPIYTLIHDHRNIHGFFKDKKIISSFLQSLPFSHSSFRWYLSLMPAAIERLDMRKFDLVLSDASAYAKGILVRPGAKHICYCHTPTRYLWSDANTYTDELQQSVLVKKFLPIILTKLRQWDYIAAQRVDHFIANSHFVARRIKKYYGKESEVIYPPVDTSSFQPSHEHKNYYLILGRLKAYKRVDLAIEAFNELGIPLVVAGTGEEEHILKRSAKSNIHFTGFVGEEDKKKLIKYCIALIQPQEEDFGITAVEAMAAGKPVIAYKAGGFLETIRENETGVFFDEQCWEALAHTIIRFHPKEFNPDTIHDYARQFSAERFLEEMKYCINRVMGEEKKTTRPLF